MSKIILINWSTSEGSTGVDERNQTTDNIVAIQMRAEKETLLMEMEDQILHILSDAQVCYQHFFINKS